ncbi:MAG: outer membrane protein assembly factor BamD [Planctomycetes bacterium]|nr:outer membrane protein assembly factor BamD [Planctomycetota bacterium]
MARLIPTIAVVLAAWAFTSCGQARADDEYEWKNGKWVKTAKPAKGSLSGELAMIRQIVKEGQTRKPLNAVKEFLIKYPTDDGCEEALHLAGLAEMNRGYYFQAFEWFEKQLNRYPDGSFVERGLQREYEIAEAFLKGKKRVSAYIFFLPAEDDGLAILGKVTSHDPNGPMGEKAMMRVAEYHYSQKDYAQAVQSYDEFVKRFSKSPQVPFVMLQAAKATYAAFKGVQFDDTPLAEALERFKVFSQAYPDLARREGVDRICRTIVNSLAEKVYSGGGFYERTGRPASAEFVYRDVLDRYPGTIWSQRARADLVRLGAKNIPGEAPASQPATRPAAATGKTPGGTAEKADMK